MVFKFRSNNIKNMTQRVVLSDITENLSWMLDNIKRKIKNTNSFEFYSKTIGVKIIYYKL